MSVRADLGSGPSSFSYGTRLSLSLQIFETGVRIVWGFNDIICAT